MVNTENKTLGLSTKELKENKLNLRQFNNVFNCLLRLRITIDTKIRLSDCTH